MTDDNSTKPEPSADTPDSGALRNRAALPGKEATGDAVQGDRSALRRALPWLGGVVTAIIIAVLTPIAQEVVSAARDRPKGPAIEVPHVSIEVNNDEDTFLFPQKLELSRSEMQELTDAVRSTTDFAAYDRWALAHGGVDDEATLIKIVVEGNRKKPVQILNVRPVKHCGNPLEGTLFYSPPAGGNDNIIIGFNLDETRPIARAITGTLYPSVTSDDPPYFDTHTVQLAKAEQLTFFVVAVTSRHYCEFSLDFVLLDGTQTVTHPIDNSGQPFKVSTVRSSADDGEPVYSQYEAVYIGGVMNGRLDDLYEFDRVDPTTYGGETEFPVIEPAH